MLPTRDVDAATITTSVTKSTTIIKNTTDRRRHFFHICASSAAAAAAAAAVPSKCPHALARSEAGTEAAGTDEQRTELVGSGRRHERSFALKQV